MRLFGRVEFIEPKGAGFVAKINTCMSEKAAGSYNVVKNMTAMKKGFHPLKRNGFMLTVTKKTRIFDPEMTRDPSGLVGKDIIIEADVRHYEFKTNETVTGWKLMAVQMQSEQP